MERDASDMSQSDSNLSCVDEEECSQYVESVVSLKKKPFRFSEVQKACLNAYYGKGMTGTGKNMHLLISKAAKDWGF